MPEYKLINNKKVSQYEFHIDGQIAKIKYTISGDQVCLNNTIVPKKLGGRGIGTELVAQVLVDIEKEGYHTILECPFIKSYAEKNKEWNKLLR